MLLCVFRNSFFLFFCLFSFVSFGKIFRCPYVMFEIEDSWECKSFGVNWVCHHYLNANSPPAFIFTTARMARSSEPLKFEEFEKNETSSSLIKPAKKVSINKHIWIDSFHQNSFYGNTLSHFERTVCCDDMSEKFQVLVGFHAFRKNYSKYVSSFLKAIRSLNLLTENLEEIKRLLKQQTNQQGQDMNNYIQNILFESSEETAPMKKEKSFTGLLLLFCLVCLFSGIIYYRKIRVKKGLKRKKRRGRK